MRLIDADKLREDLREAGMVFALRMVDAAPTIAPPPNAPLTLEELREMDGEPVWVCRKGHVESGWWCFLAKFFDDGDPGGWVSDDGCISVKGLYHVGYLPYKGCGNAWLAYRRKLEEGAT